MTCISTILKATENKPYIIERTPKYLNIVIEGGGEYKGFEWLVTFTGSGHRCGYVAIDPDNDSSYPELDCHGDVTFYGKHEAILSHFNINCPDVWIGFDCAHGEDAKDEKSVILYFGKDHAETIKDFFSSWEDYSTVKSFKFVEKQCKKIINQLINRRSNNE